MVRLDLRYDSLDYWLERWNLYEVEGHI